VSGLRVLVCDDHPVYRDGLSMLLGSLDGIEVVGAAGDGEQVIRAARELQPDVVVMDLQMPGMSGIEATAGLREEHPDLAVLVLAMYEDDESVFAAMQAGARGYLLKGANQSEIARAVTAVASGELILGPSARPPRRCVLQRSPPSGSAGGGSLPPAHHSREPDPRPARGRAQQRPDRRDPLPVAQDRAQQRLEHLRQAPGRRARRGDRPRAERRPRPLTTSSTGRQVPTPLSMVVVAAAL
jgi:DNA-binding NarL/FixJ family response regulator